MSKRYPPIFNVILFAVAVIFMLLNPIANMVPWLPDVIKTAVTAAIYAMYDFFNAAGKFIVDAYNKYVIFTLHVVIIALYGKHLFSKDVKTRYHAALKTIGEYKPKETHFGDESYLNLTIQADNVPTNDWDKSTFIGDKVKDVLSALSLLSNGEAQYDYCSYE